MCSAGVALPLANIPVNEYAAKAVPPSLLTLATADSPIGLPSVRQLSKQISDHLAE
jgi:hypothetical protein